VSTHPGTVAARAIDILIAPIERELLRVRVEQLAELWQASLLPENEVRELLGVLRPGLPPAEVWDLWVDYVDALTDYRACDGPALNLLKEVKRCCDQLTGGTR
jgi:hypothetical protein